MSRVDELLNKLKELKEANSKKKIDKISRTNEELVKVLFEEFKIKKIKETLSSSPDFEIKINNCKFIMEVKLIRDIYDDLITPIEDVLGELNMINILDKFEVYMEPCNVHKEDIDVFKSKLKEKIAQLDEHMEEYTIQIKAKNREYTVTFKKNEALRPGIRLFSGTIENEDSNLRNIFKSRRIIDQIKNADILFITCLNKFVDEDRVIEKFYYQVEVLPCSSCDNESISMTQYRIEETPWPKSDKLKLIIVLFPLAKTTVVLPRIEETKEFTTGHYKYLLHLLKRKGFKVKIAIHSTEIKGVENVS